jgi:hypothetical protein
MANVTWCLTAPDPAAGQQLTVQACDGSTSQTFTRTPVPNALELQLLAAPTLCVAADTTQPTAPVTLQACSASDSTQWWTPR